MVFKKTTDVGDDKMFCIMLCYNTYTYNNIQNIYLIYYVLSTTSWDFRQIKKTGGVT